MSNRREAIKFALASSVGSIPGLAILAGVALIVDRVIAPSNIPLSIQIAVAATLAIVGWMLFMFIWDKAENRLFKVMSHE